MRRPGRGHSGTRFEVTRRAIRGAQVVALAGDVDLATVEDVQMHLDAAISGDRPRVVVDMGRVTFVDSSFLHSLIRTWRRAQRAGGELAIVCVDPAIRRSLDVFGISKEIDVYDDVGQAVSALARP
jgi:stage II sporulation protein AA (anti-sigma F factor antagonist)